MKHSGHHEESEEIAGGRPHSRGNLLIILDAHSRIQPRVSPAEVHDDLAPMLLVPRKVRIRRVQHLVDPDYACGIFVEIETGEIVFGIRFGKGHVPKEAFSEEH